GKVDAAVPASNGDWIVKVKDVAWRVSASGAPIHKTKLPSPLVWLGAAPNGETFFAGSGDDDRGRRFFFVGKLDADGQRSWVRATRGDVDCRRTSCELTGFKRS